MRGFLNGEFLRPLQVQMEQFHFYGEKILYALDDDDKVLQEGEGLLPNYGLFA